MLRKSIFSVLFLSISILNAQKPVVLYVADPMCSWCYGFTPQFERIFSKYNGKVDFEMLMGGLNTESKKPLDVESRESFKDHWQHIHKETGMPFNLKILDLKNLVYNTELPCRAITAVKAIQPDKHIEYFKLVQKSFYAENKNITQMDVLIELAVSIGIDKDIFIRKLNSDEVVKSTYEGFERTERNGIEGFPALVYISAKETKILCSGYAKYSKIEKILDKLLSN